MTPGCTPGVKTAHVARADIPRVAASMMLHARGHGLTCLHGRGCEVPGEQ